MDKKINVVNPNKTVDKNITLEEEQGLPDVEIVDPSSDEDLEPMNISTKNKEIVEKHNKKHGEQIKEIILDKNTLKKDVENENNEDNFGETLTVSKIEVVPSYESKLGHEMFLRILENDMLRDIPVPLQSNKSIQEEIRKKAERLYNLKEEGDKLLTKEKEDGYKYIKYVEYLKDRHFDKVKWVYPVVLDQHVIYALKCDKKKTKEDINEDTDDEENMLDEIPDGDVLEDQIHQMKEINTLQKKYAKGEILIVSLYTQKREQQEPYKQPTDAFWKDENTPKAKEIRLDKYSELYRYININFPKKIKNRIGRGSTVIPLSLPEKKEKVESFVDDINVERKSITVDSGENVFIVGFLYLPSIVDNDDNLYDRASIVDEAVKNRIVIKKDSIPSLDLKKSAFLTFENGIINNHTVTSEEYLQMIKYLIPSPDVVIENIIANNNNLTLYSFNQHLKKWGYSFGSITPKSWEKARKVINENIKPDKLIHTGIKLEDIRKQCYINDDKLLRDSQYLSNIMRKIYYPDLEYTSETSIFFRGKTCDQQRINILFNTDDNGDFYYTYSFFQMKEKNDKNVKRLEEIRKGLEKEVKTTILNKIPENNYYEKIEDNSINILKLKEEFNKLIEIPSKNYNTAKKIERNKKLIEHINKFIKDYDERQKSFKELLKNKAGLLILNYMGKVTKKLDKNRITEAFLGKIMYNRELEQNNKKPTFALLEKTPIALKSVINQINQSGSFFNKKQLIYNIIQLDGIIIDNYIYSILYEKPFICGHWYYLMMIDNSNTVEERQEWVTKFLSIFGDDGESSKGEETCIICGSFLDRTQLVESMYIDQWGNPLKIREVYEEEIRRLVYLHSQQLSIYDTISIDVKKCESNEFIDFLNKRKITDKEDIRKAKLACNIINGMSTKMDINIATRHFIELIIVCVRESKKIATFNAYLEEKIKDIKIKRNLSEERALRLTESSKFMNKVIKSYYGYFTARYGTLVLAHLLWYLRTSIPQYIPGNNSTTSCSFFGFNDSNGFDYLVCIIVQTKILLVKFRSGDLVVNEVVPKHTIVKNLRYWEKVLEPNYNYALLKRQVFDKDNELFISRVGSNRIDRVKDPYKWGEEEILNLGTKEEIMSRLNSVLKSTESSAYNEIYNEILLEIRKRVFKIRNFLNNFVNDGPKSDFKEIQVSCCEKVLKPSDYNETFIDYFYDINEQIVNFSDDLIQLQMIYVLLNNFVMTTHFLISTKQIPIKNMNQTPVNLLDSPETFIKSAFEVYCHDGVTRGQNHSFSNKDFPDIEQCIKCGWLLKKIQNSDFSREEYVSLMNDVSKKELKNYGLIETVRKRLNLVSQKKNSTSEKIKEDIEKLALRIARKVSDKKISEKEIIDN